MFCNLSGETPKDPVVTRSGHVYERALLAKHLANHHTDPITNEPLSMEDLISVQVKPVVKPRPTTATSIPSMINLFQNEWDALMLETFQLKQQLENTRQELSRTLYEHDAACRVIARLMKERDEARSALEHFKANYSSNGSVSSSSDSMQVETNTLLSADIIKKIEAKAAELSAPRKKRVVSPNTASAEAIASYTAAHSRAQKSGITCVDIDANNLIVTGGVDGEVHIFNPEDKKDAFSVSAHDDAITSLICHPSDDIIITSSKDKTAKVWKKSGKSYKLSHTVSAHRGPVNAVTLHPAGELFISVSSDATAAVTDVKSGECLTQFNLGAACNSVTFHPDGQLFAVGLSNGRIDMWDIRSLQVVASFEEKPDGPIVSMNFSENGYILAAITAQSTSIWDLRKQARTKKIEGEDGFGSVAFDKSGGYLAVAEGGRVKVYNSKTFDVIATFKSHSKEVTGVKWQADASGLISISMDKNVKVWTSSKEEEEESSEEEKEEKKEKKAKSPSKKKGKR